MAGATTGGVLLLVEDDEAIGRLVKAYLEQQDGWTVVWIRSGEEAVAELRRHPVRLVVLDIGLPGIDGFEVCRQMRAHSKVPIVMLTARDEEPDRVAGLEDPPARCDRFGGYRGGPDDPAGCRRATHHPVLG